MRLPRDVSGSNLAQEGVDKLLEHDRNARHGYSQTCSEAIAGCSERLSSKAAASEEAKAYSLPYVEPLSAARTPLADYVNSLRVQK